MSKLLFPDITKENMLELAVSLYNTKYEDKLCFDFSEITWVEPFGMLYAGMIIKDYCKKNINKRYRIKYIENSDAMTYAAHMEFFKFISNYLDIGNEPGEASGNNNYMPITKINFEEEYKEYSSNGCYPETGEVIEQKAGNLSKIIAHGNQELEIVLSYCLREMIRNISEHSETSDAWVCGQYWPKKGKAEIAIVDEGVGLKQSLCNNSFHRQYISNDTDALKYAVMPGISRAFSPTKKNTSNDIWSNSGFGLYMTSSLCKKLGGKFYLATGNKCLINNKENSVLCDTKYNGAAIGIELPTNIEKASNIIKEISISGEKEAKNIRNTFESASKSSKDLLKD